MLLVAKQTQHHSVHFSPELQAIADANMKAGGFRSLNDYVKELILGHSRYLNTCAECRARQIAEHLVETLRLAEEMKTREK